MKVPMSQTIQVMPAALPDSYLALDLSMPHNKKPPGGGSI